jgi:hypothetical protein
MLQVELQLRIFLVANEVRTRIFFPVASHFAIEGFLIVNEVATELFLPLQVRLNLDRK